MVNMESRSVTVVPITGMDKVLGYKVPAGMLDHVQIGSLVSMPLLRRSELGIVKKLEAPGDYPLSKLKYISSVIYPRPVLTPDLLILADWIQKYYAVSADSIFEAMIPSFVRKGKGRKKLSYICLNDDVSQEEWELLKHRAPKQAAIIDFLRKHRDPLPKLTVLRDLKIAVSSCGALIKKGMIKKSWKEVVRSAYDDELALGEEVPALNFELNPEQNNAVQDIISGIERNKFRVNLLHGVTGSGKTEVYIQAIKQTLKLGGGVIYLVPEVALTPQTVGRLRSRLEKEIDANIVVWHSHLSDGERLDAWHALANGEARVVVGARSAIFAPIDNLRLIIVDEEHEPAYKQEETPRYHGRDVAVYRAKLNNATCILGSATPALESLYNVKMGKYHLNRLTKRVDDQKLPLMHVIDMKREIINGKGSMTLSRLLAEKMRERYEKGEQSIIFINRRGYSRSMLCPDCGYVVMCENCSVPLIYHRTDNSIRCHLCGVTAIAPRECPECHSIKIRWRGQGTQKVEEIVQKLLPQARITRMDADTMRKKNLFRKIFTDFRKGDIDVLVGTQMIAKGLDFPNVTLVGLIDADLSLHIPDFRANERTFQLLVQVAGRSGRGDRSGEVVVQSYLPHSEPIQFARQSDFDGFNTEELNHRREFHYPPFRHLIHHLFRGTNPEKVAFYAEHWVKYVEEKMGEKIEIRGPAPSPIEKVKNHYRFQVWYFITNVSKIVPRLRALRDEFKMDPDVIDVIDVDPVHLI